MIQKLKHNLADNIFIAITIASLIRTIFTFDNSFNTSPIKNSAVFVVSAIIILCTITDNQVSLKARRIVVFLSLTIMFGLFMNNLYIYILNFITFIGLIIYVKQLKYNGFFANYKKWKNFTFGSDKYSLYSVIYSLIILLSMIIIKIFELQIPNEIMIIGLSILTLVITYVLSKENISFIKKSIFIICSILITIIYLLTDITSNNQSFYIMFLIGVLPIVFIDSNTRYIDEKYAQSNQLKEVL